MADLDNKDIVFQSAANFLMHIFDEDTKIIASITKARADYDVNRMSHFIDVVMAHLTMIKVNLQRYGYEEEENTN